jgi:hypothetical protein
MEKLQVTRVPRLSQVYSTRLPGTHLVRMSTLVLPSALLVSQGSNGSMVHVVDCLSLLGGVEED